MVEKLHSFDGIVESRYSNVDVRSNKEASWTKEWGGSAGCPLFEALRRSANYALKTTTNEFIERVKRNNGQEKEGILFCPVVEQWVWRFLHEADTGNYFGSLAS